MLNFKTKLAIIGSLCALLFPTELTVQANPAQQTSPSPTATTVYQRAKAELPEDFYVIYRIVDRIARANQLDDRPWRVRVIPEYNINAFATDVNLVAVYGGIFDQLAGDASALACIVGHEMGHNVKRHIAIGEAQRAETNAQITAEAEREVALEREDANSDTVVNSVAGTILQRVGFGDIGNMGGSILQNQSRRRIEQSQERVNEIGVRKKQEQEQQIAAQIRQQEFEADEVGYLYSVKAGFEPEGCLRAMEVLARTPSAEFDTDHPAVPKRIEALKALMAEYPPQTLAQQGQNKLSTTQPLTYDLSRDGESLRVNSRHGGSVGENIDRMFGN